MAKTISGKLLLSKYVNRRDRILLVNPPVEETRYSWRRWNQPLDLLKLTSLLRLEIGCEADLFDFMKPDRDGHVREEWLPKDRRYHVVKGHRYPMRRFGQPYSLFTNWLRSKQADHGSRAPTQVWITSLCSYWFLSVAEVCRIVHQTLPDAQIVLLGQYPQLMPKHASDACAADFIVSQPVPSEDATNLIESYGSTPPPFLALQLRPNVAVHEVAMATKRGILDFTFFDDDVCRDGAEPLIKIFADTHGLHKNLRYHVICGLNPASITPTVARVLANRQFVELHFEEADAGDALDLDAYRQARAYLREAGMKIPSERLSGFVWIGRPGDQLEHLIQRTFDVLSCFGSVILKPFTPTPGSLDEKKHKTYLADIPHQNWSPHFFPFAELNGISRDEYHDLYRVAAFLNEKVRDRSFDFLNGTLGAQMLRESLRREAWKLEPTPVGLTD